MDNNNKISLEDFHFGSLLAAYIKKRKVPKAALGRKIGKNGDRILKYEKRKALDSDAIMELSIALKHNFFADIALLLPKEYTKEVPEEALLKTQISVLEREIEILKAEKAVLMEVMGGKPKS